jgi:hypothetical protein
LFCPIVEADERVGEVLGCGAGRPGGREDLLGLAASEPQHDIKIMDHEVQHDPDFDPGAVGPDTRRVDVHDVAGQAVQLEDSGVEPLDVTDLQHEPLGRCGVDQPERLLPRRRDRLLHQ